MTLVVDASVVVAALTEVGRDGIWAREQLKSSELNAPYFMPAEVTNILRRGIQSGRLAEGDATVAFRELLTLAVEFHEFLPLASRVWQLRENVSAYDAWYVALAESLDAPLATLDRRLTRASGPRCEFLTPET